MTTTELSREEILVLLRQHVKDLRLLLESRESFPAQALWESDGTGLRRINELYEMLKGRSVKQP